MIDPNDDSPPFVGQGAHVKNDEPEFNFRAAHRKPPQPAAPLEMAVGCVVLLLIAAGIVLLVMR